jgi:hypothetical protein
VTSALFGGTAIVPKLSKELQTEFPDTGGFSTTNLWLMAQFYTEYHKVENLVPLVREISWSKHVSILKKFKDNLHRYFFINATKSVGSQKMY